MKHNSKRDLIFITILLAVLIVMVISDTDVDILVNYDEELLQVTSPRLNIDIEHAHVQRVSLISMPEFGSPVGDSYEHEAYCAGTWKNPELGVYTLCVIPSNATCILVEVQDSGFIVFSCTTDEQTAALFESYSNYISRLAA